MKQEVMNFLKIKELIKLLRNCSEEFLEVQLGNELINIFRNAAIGTTVRGPQFQKCADQFKEPTQF
jgi:hypothetical protein